jgi:large subunit ribosomal protein L6
MYKVSREWINLKDLTNYSVSDNLITMDGAFGTNQLLVPEFLSINIDENKKIMAIELKDAESKIKHHIVMNGTMVRLIKNLVIGATIGFKKTFIFQGLGYRYTLENNNTLLNIQLGYSHPILLKIPEKITAKGIKVNVLELQSIDNVILGNYSHKLKILRKWNPYKGKGIMEENETVKTGQSKRKNA